MKSFIKEIQSKQDMLIELYNAEVSKSVKLKQIKRINLALRNLYKKQSYYNRSIK